MIRKVPGCIALVVKRDVAVISIVLHSTKAPAGSSKAELADFPKIVSTVLFSSCYPQHFGVRILPSSNNALNRSLYVSVLLPLDEVKFRKNMSVEG